MATHPRLATRPRRRPGLRSSSRPEYCTAIDGVRERARFANVVQRFGCWFGHHPVISSSVVVVSDGEKNVVLEPLQFRSPPITVGVVRWVDNNHPEHRTPGGIPVITTTDAPTWLRRSDQAITWASTMLQPRRAVVINCETTDLPGAPVGKARYST